MAKPPKLIKICLCDEGEDHETVFAEDLGPAPGPKGSRKAKLLNVPFVHVKPTWGDTVVVSPVADGMLTWDSRGVAESKLGTRIFHDGRRHAMIVDYTLRKGTAAAKAFAKLTSACEQLDVACEGYFGPEADRPGRVYLAAGEALTPTAVMDGLRAGKPPYTLTQVYPAVKAKRKRAR